MSGFVSVSRYTFKMTISEQDILQTLIKSRNRIAAFPVPALAKSKLPKDKLVVAGGAPRGFDPQSAVWSQTLSQ